MRHTHPVLISAILVSNFCHAGQALVLDGREISLNDDGTWRYLSTDRFVDTPDGKRIRLMEDGRWEYIGNAPLTADRHQRTSTLDMQLDDVVIERTEKKVQKNTRVKTRTVFVVNIARAAEAEGALRLDRLGTDSVSVTDDDGNAYDVIGIEPGRAEIAPGKSTTITVVVDKSPSIFDDVRSMSIEFDQDAFDTPSTVTLTRNMDDVDKVKVDTFDQD